MAAEALVTSLDSGDTDLLLRWLTGQNQDGLDTDVFNCTRSEFITHFLCYLRNQTESILQTNASALQILQHQSTPEKLLSHKKAQAIDITETPISAEDHSLSVKTDRRRQESPSKDKSKKPGRRVKTKLFNENEQIEAITNESIVSSTPIKNSDFPHLLPTSPVTPSLDLSVSRNSSKYTSHSDSSKERCDTPRIPNSRNSSRLSSAEKSINLGDYITNATKVNSKKKKSFKNVSNESVQSKENNKIDLSSADMFPEIGAKRTSRSSEKRRINPTNIDGSASSSGNFAVTSFTNSEAFPKPPSLAFEENSAFKQQKFQPKELSTSFNTERSILKQERQKLMEKFNILNTPALKISPMTPQIKILKTESVEKTQTYVEADINKVTFKDKLETLAEIYNALLKNTLVLNVSTEIYFTISIILSKQCADDYECVENNLKSDNNICDFLLKSIHNSSYVAIQTLWSQRNIVEVMLDKLSLKLLGENKRVRSFFPDLAKHLLNLYSLKCEGDMYSGREEAVNLEKSLPNGVVCFNSETDNVDNFPSVLSFQNFKKQRDMFYEILRWWSEPANQSIGSARTLLRSRVKSLLSLAITPANHSHLARLFISHLTSECISSSQESKLSKLQRRLTGPTPTPASVELHRLPRFTPREEFYRLFLLVAESEGFRAHVRDGLACELCSLDTGCLPSCDDRHDSSPGEIRQEYLSSLKRLRLLAKFLGLLTSAPYQPVTELMEMMSAVVKFVPKEKIFVTEQARRNHIQPPIDLQSILEAALENNRLSVTIPWLILYLAMMDYIALRIKYYHRLLSTLLRIYTSLPHYYTAKNASTVFLKLCLGWLFELPHFPQENFYETHLESGANILWKFKSEWSVDSLELVDENVLAEVCPYLKEFNFLLLTSHPSNDVKDAGSFRHITPVTMSFNLADRAKNKERELQARLEEELLHGQASSTRRVLELVADRVMSATVKELASSLLGATRVRCREEALGIVQAWRGGSDTTLLLKQLEQMYSAQLARMRSTASENARTTIASRVRMALRALLPSGTATAPLETIALRQTLARVNKWLAENWSNVGVLCKDISGEISHLLLLGSGFLPTEPCSTQPLSPHKFEATSVSAAELIINLKELVCQLLEYSEEVLEVPSLLELARLCCRTDNLFITPTSRKAVLQLSVDLIVVLVSRTPQDVTEILLSKFDALWNECCPNRHRNKTDKSVQNEEFTFNPRDFAPDDDRMPTPVSSDDENTTKPVKIIIDTSEIGDDTSSRNDGSNSFKLHRRNSSKMYESRREARKSDVRLSKLGRNLSKSPNSKSDTNLSTSPTSLSKPTLKVSRNVSKSDSNVSSKSSPDVSRSELNVSKTENTENGEDLLDLFNRILCPRNVVILSETRSNKECVWRAMTDVLVFLLKNDYLSEDSLTEQCLAVYRQDWNQSVLELLSTCMRGVSSRRGRGGSKFTLFLDFLAEFCGDMELDLPL